MFSTPSHPSSTAQGPARPGLQRLAQTALRWALLLAMAALAVGALRTLWPATVADLGTAPARAAMMKWRENPRPVTLKEWAAWRADLARGLAQTPDDSLLHDHMGYLYGAYAQQSKAVPDLARDFFVQAHTSFSRAASLRPMAPELAQNAGLAADLSGLPAIKPSGLAWSCRSIRYTAPGVPLSQYLQGLPSGACP